MNIKIVALSLRSSGCLFLLRCAGFQVLSFLLPVGCSLSSLAVCLGSSSCAPHFGSLKLFSLPWFPPNTVLVPREILILHGTSSSFSTVSSVLEYCLHLVISEGIRKNPSDAPCPDFPCNFPSDVQLYKISVKS